MKASKIAKFLVVVVIPATAGLLVGLYFYRKYQNEFRILWVDWDERAIHFMQGGKEQKWISGNTAKGEVGKKYIIEDSTKTMGGIDQRSMWTTITTNPQDPAKKEQFIVNWANLRMTKK